MNVPKKKVLIVGCGSIGALKPELYDRKLGANILTHAHAVTEHPKTELAGVMDIDTTKMAVAQKKWDVPLGGTTLDIFWDRGIDIAIIATDTSQHSGVMKEVLHKVKPSVIICEKPFGNNIKEALAMKKMADRQGVPIMVNYLRRYNKHIQDLALDIHIGKYGKVFNCTLKYTRGLKREASHGIDLMRYLFGSFLGGAGVLGESNISDFSKKDPTVAAHLSFLACPNCFLIPVDGRAYSLFEMDIYTEVCRIQLTANGNKINYYIPEQETTYGQYLSLSETPWSEEYTNLTITLVDVIGNAEEIASGNGKAICSSIDAIAVHEIINYMTTRKK